MLTIVPGIAWMVLLTWLSLGLKPHDRVVDRVSLNHCRALPQPTCWEGQECATEPIALWFAKTRGTYPRDPVMECFPKDGCWLEKNGDAMCWRTATLKARRR